MKAVYGRRSGGGPTPTFRVGSNIDQLGHGLYSLLGDSHGLGSSRATSKLVAWLKREKSDVIGLHNLHGYFLNLPILFQHLLKANRPVVWTLHDCWPFTGHCSYFDRFDCQRWKTGCHDCPMTGYYPRSLIDRSRRNWHWKKALLQDFPHLFIVTPSHWLKALVQQSFLGRHPIHVIHNGVNLEVFKPVCEQKRRLVLGVANQWDDRKGLRDFFELRSALGKEWSMLLVGLSRSQRKALPDGIQSFGRIQSVEKLAEIYSSATVFFNPTYSDNFPTTNIEALACGTPVVTYRTGGSPESVDKGTGRIVEQGNISDAVEAISALARLPAAQLVACCRARAEMEFSAVARFADYIDLVECIAAPQVRAEWA